MYVLKYLKVIAFSQCLRLARMYGCGQFQPESQRIGKPLYSVSYVYCIT